VASQLNPEQFAVHYRAGSTRYYSGRVLFAEVSTDFRQDYFDIERAFGDLKPHPDGSPKATKFIRNYRVLEHMDFGALGSLYITSPNGRVLELSQGEYDKTHQPGFLRTFAEISPPTMLVLTSHDLPGFSAYITDPKNPKGAPRVFFTQIDLDIDEFMQSFKDNPFMPPPLPDVHPAKLRDAIELLRGNSEKAVKGLSLRADLEHIQLGRIRHGFVFAAPNELVYYPMPSLEEIKEKNFEFYRSM